MTAVTEIHTPGGLEKSIDLSQADVHHWIRLTITESTGIRHPMPLDFHTTAKKDTRVTVTTTNGTAGVGTTSMDATARSIEVTVPHDGVRTIWVAPLRVGGWGRPGDTLTVTTIDTNKTVKIDVWIEPTEGQWQSAGPGGDHLELGIVAVHASLMRKHNTTEVLMWSPPRKRDHEGWPMPDPKRDGQWLWDVFALNDLEARVLELDTWTVRDRLMRQGERSNIFCGGEAHLPDGRLFVAGGHMSHHLVEEQMPPGQQHGTGNPPHNADRLHTYNAEDAVGWRRLEPELKPMRWYPTVTTLPDGRMLITSGSGAVLLGDLVPGDPDNQPETGYWRTVQNNYWIFNPLTEKWDVDSAGPHNAPQLVDDHKLAEISANPDEPELLATYPSVFVLPGPAGNTWLALVETNRTWLYSYYLKETAPLAREERMYRMNTKGSRSYPHYGAVTLLPFHAGDTMRILAVGGQHEDQENHRLLDGSDSTSKTQQPTTDTAEIFTVDPRKSLAEQGGWAWTTTKMRHARVMCEATLLADGTVLISGGAAKGWTNINSTPVYEAELFHPDSGSFTPAGTARIDRRYHSTCLLLPDGSALKAGSTGGFSNETGKEDSVQMDVRTQAERYLPPYLWRGPRRCDFSGRCGAPVRQDI
jgi:hypothetical protein